MFDKYIKVYWKCFNELQTSFWVNTERTFEQMIESFADVDVKPRVAVL